MFFLLLYIAKFIKYTCLWILTSTSPFIRMLFLLTNYSMLRFVVFWHNKKRKQKRKTSGEGVKDLRFEENSTCIGLKKKFVSQL